MKDTDPEKNTVRNLFLKNQVHPSKVVKKKVLHRFQFDIDLAIEDPYGFLIPKERNEAYILYSNFNLGSGN